MNSRQADWAGIFVLPLLIICFMRPSIIGASEQSHRLPDFGAWVLVQRGLPWAQLIDGAPFQAAAGLLPAPAARGPIARRCSATTDLGCLKSQKLTKSSYSFIIGKLQKTLGPTHVFNNPATDAVTPRAHSLTRWCCASAEQLAQHLQAQRPAPSSAALAVAVPPAETVRIWPANNQAPGSITRTGPGGQKKLQVTIHLSIEK